MSPMLKQFLLVLVAASLVWIAVPFAAAQDSQSNDQQSPSQDNGMHRRGRPDPAEHTRELTKQLKLTPDQQTKVLDIYTSAHSQMESLHQDSSLSQEDRRTKMMEIHKNADTQVRALLDPAQQKKFDEMQAKREQWMQNRHGDGGSGQQGPPPQQ
jgi:protein CpxP